MTLLPILLAALSVLDYPARQVEHDRLRAQFVQAVREGDTLAMEDAARKGVKLLPDDPTWRYNLACSLAYYEKREKDALDALEEAIDLGFRDADAIAADRDLARLKHLSRFGELVEYARSIRTKPVLTGLGVCVDATGVFGRSILLGAHNLSWDFDTGSFQVALKLATASAGGNTGDLYVNRDGRHSALNQNPDRTFTEFPGLTDIRFDRDITDRRLDQNAPNMLFPYPVFGNCSQAYTHGPYWRSIPRALVTTDLHRLRAMARYYLSNQTWAFPSNADTAPVGTNGDVIASITPYWIMTAGRSWSDTPYLKGALAASRALQPDVKNALVARGLLAPTIQTLIRKSLADVKSEADYVTSKAHPTALPPDALDVNRLAAAAAALSAKSVPPLVTIAMKEMTPPAEKPTWPELTYATPQAWAYVLRAAEKERVFCIVGQGAETYSFTLTHGADGSARLKRLGKNAVEVTVAVPKLNPTNRVDVTIVGRNAATGWGAPAYVSFARMDPAAPYSDPVLTPRADPPPAPSSTNAVKRVEGREPNKTL